MDARTNDTAPARELLTTAEAAAHCGYRTPSGLRKAVFDGKVRAVGRRAGGGTCMFDVQDVERLRDDCGRDGDLESIAGGHAEREAVDALGVERLVTADAARYCGYRSASSLRKAAFANLISPVGRISTNGPNVWLVSDLRIFLVGKRPPVRDGSSTFTRAGVPRISRMVARPVPKHEPTKEEPEPTRVQRRGGRLDMRRSYTTRHVAAWYRVSVEHVREWVRRHTRWDGRLFVASFGQMSAVRAPGGRWHFYMRVAGDRASTSRPPAAEARRRSKSRNSR